ISYVHYNDGSALQLYPESSEDEDGALLNLWTGGGEMGTGYIVGEMTRDDWLATRAFLDVTVATDDGSKVRIDSLDLVADESMPHLKPMLEPRGVAGCVGHRPVFDFVNRGWGAVEAPSLRVRFANPASFDLDGDGYTPATDWLEVPVQPFDAGGTVDVTPALAALGVDTATLAGSRFTCPSHEMLGTCTANLLSSVEFGGLEPAVKIIAPDAD